MSELKFVNERKFDLSTYRLIIGNTGHPLPAPSKHQKDSYDDFLQINSSKRSPNSGLEQIFRSAFPIYCNKNRIKISYVGYKFGKPLHSEKVCVECGYTYELPFKVNFEVYADSRIVQEEEEDIVSQPLKPQNVESINWKLMKDVSVFLGNIPVMSDQGDYFIVNGARKVIINSLAKASGVMFYKDNPNVNDIGNIRAAIIPQSGTWLKMFLSPTKDQILIQIDKSKPVNLMTFLMALPKDPKEDKIVNNIITLSDNYSVQELFSFFFKSFPCRRYDKYKRISVPLYSSYFARRKLTKNMLDTRGRVIIDAENTTEAMMESTCEELIKNGYRSVLIDMEDVPELHSIGDVYLKSDDKLPFLSAGSKITKATLEEYFSKAESDIISIIDGDGISKNLYFLHTYNKCESVDRKECTVALSKVLKYQKTQTVASSAAKLYNMFYNPGRYYMSQQGRDLITKKLDNGVHHDCMTIHNRDIIATIQYLLKVYDKDSVEVINDLDSLAVKGFKNIGSIFYDITQEMMQVITKNIKEKLVMTEDMLMSTYYFQKNMAPLVFKIKEAFHISTFCQFREEHNKLASTFHSSRIAPFVAVNQVGKTSSRNRKCSLEERVSHYSFHDKICIISTPESQMIGMSIVKAACSIPDALGFLTTPYYVVVNGCIMEQIEYLSADSENNKIIAEFQSIGVLEDGTRMIKDEMVLVKSNGEIFYIHRNKVTHVESSPYQSLSVISNLCPFIPFNDGHRVMMWSNMGRQIHVSITSQTPIICTGIGSYIIDSANDEQIRARYDCTISSVSGKIITTIGSVDGNFKMDIYHLKNFERSNQNSCDHHKAIVTVGQKVKAGDVIAHTMSACNNELALGNNYLTALVVDSGTYEDGIVMSEEVNFKDIATTLYSTVVNVSVNDFLLGEEKLTLDVDLDPFTKAKMGPHGVIKLGEYVRSGDIVACKVTPNNISLNTVDRRIASILSGNTNINTKTSFIRVPMGVEGFVSNIVMRKRQGSINSKVSVIENEQIYALKEFYDKFIKMMYSSVKMYIKDKVGTDPYIEGELEIAIGHPNIQKKYNKYIVEYKEMLEKCLTQKEKHEVYKIILKKITDDTKTVSEKLCKRIMIHPEISLAINEVQSIIKNYEAEFQVTIERIMKGIDLRAVSILELDIVISEQRQMQLGDKFVGTFGDKGVVAKITPIECMPYIGYDDTDSKVFRDYIDPLIGAPVHTIMNPFSVLSRFNFGQLMEAEATMVLFLVGRKIYNYYKDLRKSDVENDDYIKNIIRKSLCIDIDTYSKEEQDRIIENVQHGIRITYPSFTDCNNFNTWIDNLRLLMDFKESDGRYALFDGIDGKKIGRVLVGYRHLFVLHHKAKEKRSARGSKHPTTFLDQPNSGRALTGGQRLGEMESVAIMTHGAMHICNSLLSYYSDGFTTIKDSNVIGEAGSNVLYYHILAGKYSPLPKLAVCTSTVMFCKLIEVLGIKVTLTDSYGDEIKFDRSIDDNKEIKIPKTESKEIEESILKKLDNVEKTEFDVEEIAIEECDEIEKEDMEVV